MAEAKTFLDPEIEAALLASVLQGKEDLTRSGIIEVMNDSHFNVPAYQWLVSKFDLTKPLAKPILLQRLAEDVQSLDEREKLILALTRLYELDLSWLEDAILTFKRFLTFQSTSIAIKRFFEDFSRTRNVEIALRELDSDISSVSHLFSKCQVQVVDYAKTYQQRESARRYKRDNPDLYPRLRMGVSKFDAQVKMEAGTVTNFLAPMKRYKSIVLASLAYAGLLQGFNVAFVVIENTIELTLNRLDSMFSQINYDRIVNCLKTPEEKKKVEELFAKLHSWPQRLKVIKGEPHLLGTKDVERELKVLEQTEGFVADVKIYDYANLLRPSTSERADDHLGQTQLVWDLQEVAKAQGKQAIVVTATQANMAGAEVDKDGKPVKLRQHHQGRALGIAQAVDATIAIDIEVGKVEQEIASPPQIVLSPLYLRDGVILYPEVKLVSEIDRMCLDREQRALWEEVENQ